MAVISYGRICQKRTPSSGSQTDLVADTHGFQEVSERTESTRGLLVNKNGGSNGPIIHT